MFEDNEHVHLDKKRWYAGSARLSDGSMIVIGGTDDNINYNLNPTSDHLSSFAGLCSSLESQLRILPCQR